MTEPDEGGDAPAPGSGQDAYRAVPSADEIRSVMAPGADQDARNQALRRLFLTEPHFRQSDGLDVGLDEVFEIQQSPAGRRRKILLARRLGLLDDELVPQDLPERD
jgi:hypothetical protein